MSVAERLKRLGAWAERDVRDVILPFWTSDFIVDPENGGFYGRVTLDMKIDNTEPRGLTLTGRMLYAFSTAYRVFGDELYREKAAYTFRYLMDHFYDKEQGGAYITLSPQGEVLDDSKPSYCKAFLVLGCAAYGWAAGDQEALKVARETFEILESKMKFAPGCYYSNMSRDWKPVEGANLGNRKTSAFPKGSIMFPPSLVPGLCAAVSGHRRRAGEGGAATNGSAGGGHPVRPPAAKSENHCGQGGRPRGYPSKLWPRL